VPVVGVVDTAVAGHLPGAHYVGGVGVAAMVFNFVFWGFSFLRLSTTGYVAQALGRRDPAELRAVVLRAGVIALIVAAGLIVVQVPLRWLCLTLLAPSAAVAEQATIYYDVRIWAAPAVLGNYIVLGALIGLQRAGWALVTQLVIVAANVALVVLFVFGFGWQVEGLAAGTLVAEYGGLALGAAVLLSVAPGRGTPWPWAAARQRAGYRALLALNRDLLIRTTLLNIAFALFVALGARIDDVTLAANEVLMMLFGLVAYALDGFANASEAIVGEATGGRRRADLERAVAVAAIWAGLTAALSSLVFVLCGDLLIAAMTDIEPVRETARAYLPWVALLPLVGVWPFLLDGVFVGATRGRDMRNSMFEMMVVYVPLTLLLWRTMGNHGLWLAVWAMMVLRALTLLLRWPALLRQADGTAA
jgi:MATE family multidrug resistance protein